MKKINLFIFLCFSLNTNFAMAQEDVDGLGKVERIERLEAIVNSLKEEVDKLKKNIGAGEENSEGQNTYARHIDLAQLKSELSSSIQTINGTLKTDIVRNERKLSSIEGQINNLREGEIKDLSFKIDVIQKAFDALEKASSATE